MLSIFKNQLADKKSRKSVKAGILLYALVIASIFGLLLQFCLQCQLAEKRQLILRWDRLQAQLMLDLAQQKLKNQTGQVQFDTGSVSLQKNTALVSLKDGTQVHFGL